MKDAHGHGSNGKGGAGIAHQTGVNAVGRLSKADRDMLTPLGLKTLMGSRKTWEPNEPSADKMRYGNVAETNRGGGALSVASFGGL